MSVIITSFRESDKMLKKYPSFEPWSVSRWQPKGYFYDVLEYLGAYDKHGKRLRLQGSSIERYKEEWKDYLRQNITWLNKWLKSLDNHHDIMLCCWCPYSRSTIHQMKVYDNFVCHTGLIGRLINKARPDIHLLLDKDHAHFLIPQWKPFKYRIIDDY